jgi:hypothetical protein
MRAEDILSVPDMYVTIRWPSDSEELSNQTATTCNNKNTNIKSIKRQLKQSWTVFH